MAGLVSEQAVAAATAELLSAAATLDDMALGTVAGDLAAVSELLSAQPHLRRLLTETTATGEAKAGLVRRLIGERVSPATVRIVAQAVGRRWTSGTDLVDGVRRLAHTAVFLRAERAGDLDEVEDQLFRFGRILDAAPELAEILDDASTAAEGRTDLVRRLLAGKAHPLTTTLLVSLARDPGGRSFSHGVAQLVSEAAARREKLVAIVTSAVSLTPADVERLRGSLERIYSHPMAIHVIVDASLRGGLRLRVGDEVIDGSVAGRLDELYQRMARR